MNSKEFIEKLKKNIDANTESFVENMKREGVVDMDYCGWFSWFFAWMECETEEECENCHDEVGDSL